MERIRLLQQIYSQLAKLESELEEPTLSDSHREEALLKVNGLLKKLYDTMNSVCPIIK